MIKRTGIFNIDGTKLQANASSKKSKSKSSLLDEYNAIKKNLSYFLVSLEEGTDINI